MLPSVIQLGFKALFQAVFCKVPGSDAMVSFNLDSVVASHTPTVPFHSEGCHKNVTRQIKRLRNKSLKRFKEMAMMGCHFCCQGVNSERSSHDEQWQTQIKVKQNGQLARAKHGRMLHWNHIMFKELQLHKYIVQTNKSYLSPSQILTP